MARDNLFSSELDPLDEDGLELEIRRAVSELRAAFPESVGEPLGDEERVVLPLSVGVDLPSRGPVGGVDIRETEPILLVFHRRDYPYQAPAVFSDRSDFPGARLAHLNPVTPGASASFCLHRGNIDDWFAEHTILDLIGRVKDWLRDAAMDRLMRENDRFEPTRLDSTIGYVVYDPPDLENFVRERWRQNGGKAGFALLWHEWLRDPADPRAGADVGAIRLVHPLSLKLFSEPQDVLTRLVNEALRERGTRWENRLIGVLAWPDEGRVCDEYFAELPGELSAFGTWAKTLGLPLRGGIKTYVSSVLHLTMDAEGMWQVATWTPVTLVVPRPRPLIGTDSTLELLDFMVEAGDMIRPNKTWNLKARVARMGHRTPLRLKTAREISSRPPDADLGKLLFFGCGAVGSKVILHLARSGQGRMTLVDRDTVSPHNLVRYGLSYESVGMYKAEALKQAVEGMFYADDATDVEAVTASALSFLRGDNRDALGEHSWLVDATASSTVLDALSATDLPHGLSCCRCEIADRGQLGFLTMEGAARNPRLDDLRAILIDRAVEDEDLFQWLRGNREQRERGVGAVLEEINVGISCSSETMRLADEDVSLHAAAFSRGFRHYATDERRGGGRVQIGRLGPDADPAASVERFDVPPMTVLRARNDPDWQIRLAGGLKRELAALLEETAPAETGGILIGMVNPKTKTVYVTRALPAPPDSVGEPGKFVRGTEKVPEELARVADRTGGVLYYVGDWHSHPGGGPGLSSTDKVTAADLRRDLGGIPVPAHLLVATDGGLHPYVFPG
jgi:hypothetical protein